jgi:hypothetical protein
MIKCLSNAFCSDSSNLLVLRAVDCLVRIKSWSSFIYQLLKECRSINFSKRLVLGTFIRKQRPDNSLTTPDSRLHAMESMLKYLT